MSKGKKKSDEKKAAKKKPKKIAEAGVFVPSPASGIADQAEASEALDPELIADLNELMDQADPVQARIVKQDAEVARQWLHRKKVDYKLEGPGESALDGEGEQPEGEVGKPTPSTAPAEPKLGLEPAVDPVLVNGNGQAMIHYLDPVTGKEKVKGYTRATTYIKGLEDTSVLEKWKMRTLLEGAAVEYGSAGPDTDFSGFSVPKVARSIKRLDGLLVDIDRREKVDGELLELRRQELLKEHKDLLEGIAEELMELGGAHEKANKGTDLHRLTELVDNGLPLPEDITASDRRDVEAYIAKRDELGLEVLWTERRVVLDDIQVSGTMDRAYRVKLPGMQRRIRVVGDLKTGSVSWGASKIGMQLALYAQGLGYDHAQPLERERLSLSKAYGLLIHLPQGEGRCEVYLVDLELAAKGLDLARQVREWRNTGKRVYDLKSPLKSAEQHG